MHSRNKVQCGGSGAACPSLERTKGGAYNQINPLNTVGRGADGHKARAFLVTIISRSKNSSGVKLRRLFNYGGRKVVCCQLITITSQCGCGRRHLLPARGCSMQRYMHCMYRGNLHGQHPWDTSEAIRQLKSRTLAALQAAVLGLK